MSDNNDEMFESIVRIILNQSSSSDDDDHEYAFLLGEYVMEALQNGKTTKTISKSLVLMGEPKEIVQRVIEYVEQTSSSANDVTLDGTTSKDDETTSKNDETKDEEKIAKARTRLHHLLQEKYPELNDEMWGLTLSHVELGSHICILLDEPKENKMVRAIDRLGKSLVVNVLRETLCVQQIGGLKVASGERRRTPGGVFWTLLESQITKEDKKYITKLERQARNRRRNAGRQINNTKMMNHSENRRYQHKQRRYSNNNQQYGTDRRRECTKSRQRERRHRSQMNRRRKKYNNYY